MTNFKNVNLPVHLINNMLSDKIPCGYCHSRIHPGYLSKNLIKSKQRLKKNCTLLEKNPEHQYMQIKQKDKNKTKLFQRLKTLYYDDIISAQEYRKLNKLIVNGIPVNDIIANYELRLHKH